MIDTEVLEQIGADARSRLVGAYERMRDNGADQDTIRRVLVDMMLSGKAGAMVDGEALALRQLDELGVDVAPNALRPRQDRDAYREAVKATAADRARYAAGVDTILAAPTPEALAMQLGRMALSEAIEAARGSTTAIMRRSKKVDGWTRQLDSDPCELCRWWARDGRIWPAGHEMPTHKGCACAQRWVKAPEISVPFTSAKAEAASARRASAGTLDERRGLNEYQYSAYAEGRSANQRDTVAKRRAAEAARRAAERKRRRGGR